MGEIDLMGRRRRSVTSHPSCDFHVRDGITPIIARSTPRQTAVVRSRHAR